MPDARTVFQPAPVEPVREEFFPVSEAPQKTDVANLASDLDLPAFLRRRTRLASPGI
jgi:hypothetical protein